MDVVLSHPGSRGCRASASHPASLTPAPRPASARQKSPRYPPNCRPRSQGPVQPPCACRCRQLRTRSPSWRAHLLLVVPWAAQRGRAGPRHRERSARRAPNRPPASFQRTPDGIAPSGPFGRESGLLGGVRPIAGEARGEVLLADRRTAARRITGILVSGSPNPIEGRRQHRVYVGSGRVSSDSVRHCRGRNMGQHRVRRDTRGRV